MPQDGDQRAPTDDFPPFGRDVSLDGVATRVRVDVRDHLAILLEHGLVEYYDEDRAIYQLTDAARRYLAGEIGAEALEPDDED